MFHAELVMVSVINDKFHSYAEQIIGENTATIVQRNKKLRSKLAYALSYLKAFFDPRGDTTEVQPLLGLFHIGMLVAAQEYDMEEILAWPHNLTTLKGAAEARGASAVIFAGTADKWRSAVSLGLQGPVLVQAWAKACHGTFAKNGLDEILGEIKQKKRGYYLTD